MLELSERNVKVLLSKLDRRDRGEDTACTLIKGCGTVVVATENTLEYNPNIKVFQISREELNFILQDIGGFSTLNYCTFKYKCIPDSVAYADREPGVMHPSDTPLYAEDILCGGAQG